MNGVGVVQSEIPMVDVAHLETLVRYAGLDYLVSSSILLCVVFWNRRITEAPVVIFTKQMWWTRLYFVSPQVTRDVTVVLGMRESVVY